MKMSVIKVARRIVIGTYEVKGIGEGMGGRNRAPGQSTNVIADRENLLG
jgi:hypothetical protein